MSSLNVTSTNRSIRLGKKSANAQMRRILPGEYNLAVMIGGAEKVTNRSDRKT